MSATVVSLEADHSVDLAMGVMRVKRIRHLPVVERGRLVGLVTQRDLMAAQAAQLARPTSAAVEDRDISVPVGDVMQTNVWSVTPDTPVLEAARIMLDHKYGCLPVTENDRLVGIVTQFDLLKVIVDALERRRDREETDPGIG